MKQAFDYHFGDHNVAWKIDKRAQCAIEISHQQDLVPTFYQTIDLRETCGFSEH
jgi:hypothetical protein